ncbi:MAG TPA: efflux RND transporter permease subunit, partial [Thermoanaerobaculia bacterium]|nr:efflux RND transporter permease subunit [Thermoanaerobaculia bacterium]
MRFLHRVYDPLFDAALRRPRLAVFLRAIPILACVALFPLLGREFMPKLEEGNLWIRATLPLSINRERAAGYAARMSDILRGCPREGICTEKDRKHPEVLSVTWQVGRPDDGTDVTGFSNIELFAPLVPLDKLPHGQTKQELIAGFETELKAEFPGVFFGFSQMISDNVEEVLAGVKGENAVKVFGPDLRQDEKYAHEVAAAIASVKGISDLGVFDTMGQPNMKIVVDRKACARYGLNTGDVNAVVQAAIGGATVTQVFEGEKVFAVTVRWMAQYRQSVEAVREIPVGTPDGYAIPLGQLASVSLVEGPSTVWREDAIRYIPVKFSVRGRDLASAVAEAQKAVAEKVKLPYGIHL